MKFTPCATARSSCACASASLFCSPKVIVPRANADTFRSLAPSCLYSMFASLVRYLVHCHSGESRNPAFLLKMPLCFVAVLRRAFLLTGFPPDELLAIRLNWQTTPAKPLVMRGNDGTFRV